MKTIQRRDARAFATVERAEENGPPTAFLIWKEGMNVTDHGPTVFSNRSARLLLEEQETRGNRYSMDVNHLSLNPDAPIENQRAVGFFSLEVRDSALWAVDCEWTDTVVAGLTKKPPEWKYFSPAYDVDKETDEVVSFLNCALTNNPATHHVTALATRGAGIPKLMKYADAMAAMAGDDEEKKAAAIAAIKAAFGEDEDAPKSKKDPKEDASDDADEKDSADDSPPKSSDDSAGDGSKGEPKEKKDAADDADEKDASASVTAALDAKVRKLETDLASFTAERDAKERKSLIAGRVMSTELAKFLSKKPVTEVAAICATLPRKSPKDLAAEASVQATRGEDQGGRTPRLPPEQREQMDQRMGLKKKAPEVRRDGRHQIFETMTPADARRAIQASNAKKEGTK
jgi:hypothetical protein